MNGWSHGLGLNPPFTSGQNTCGWRVLVYAFLLRPETKEYKSSMLIGVWGWSHSSVSPLVSPDFAILGETGSSPLFMRVAEDFSSFAVWLVPRRESALLHLGQFSPASRFRCRRVQQFAAATTAAGRQVTARAEVGSAGTTSAQLQRNAARRPHGFCVTNERNQDENQKL
jgi:hypothetical protein